MMAAWLFAIDLLSIYLLYTTFKIRDLRIRAVLQLLLVAMLAWTNGLLLLYQPWLPDDLRVQSARAMFGGSMATLLMFSAFIPLFCGSLHVFRHPAHILLVVGQLVFVGLCFSDLVVRSVEYTPQLLRIKYGPGQPVFVFFFWASGGWLYSIIYRAMRRAATEMERTQLRWLFVSSGLAYFGILITNGLLPIALGHSNWSFLGSVFVISFYCGILYLMLRGDILYVREALNRLVLRSEMRNQPDNLQTVRAMIGTVNTLITEDPRALERQFPFMTASGRTSIVLKSGGQALHRGKTAFSQGWIMGLLDRVTRIEKENARLFMSFLADSARQGNEGGQPSPRHLIANELHTNPDEAPPGLSPLELAERNTIIHFLRLHDYHQAKTSKELKIRPNTLMVKMRKYEIRRPGAKGERSRSR